MVIDTQAVTGLTGSTPMGKNLPADTHATGCACVMRYMVLSRVLRLICKLYVVREDHIVPRYAFTRRVSEHWRVRYTFDWYNAH
jgi:hypothetical protein